jgi:hypothetical protein
VGGKSSLRVYGGSERGVRRRESEEEGLALVVDLTAASLFDGLPQDLLMLGEDGSVLLAQLLQEPGRALDVREEERDRPRRKLNQFSSLRRSNGSYAAMRDRFQRWRGKPSSSA